jgi:hypothetical protein
MKLLQGTDTYNQGQDYFDGMEDMGAGGGLLDEMEGTAGGIEDKLMQE